MDIKIIVIASGRGKRFQYCMTHHGGVETELTANILSAPCICRNEEIQVIRKDRVIFTGNITYNEHIGTRPIFMGLCDKFGQYTSKLSASDFKVGDTIHVKPASGYMCVSDFAPLYVSAMLGLSPDNLQLYQK